MKVFPLKILLLLRIISYNLIDIKSDAVNAHKQEKTDKYI
jgi:hypothetical protein